MWIAYSTETRNDGLQPRRNVVFDRVFYFSAHTGQSWVGRMTEISDTSPRSLRSCRSFSRSTTFDNITRHKCVFLDGKYSLENESNVKL